MSDWAVWLTWLIFLLTYAGLAIGKVPGLRMDRAGIAFVGATLMLVTGVLGLEQAVSLESIDFKTLFLLFGMMIVVGELRLSGFFERLTGMVLRRITTPKGLLAVTVGLSGVLSAFLINDVVCVALTPLVLHLARRLKFDPIPHLIGLATAANVGSTGTITGNPQNIYIGTHSGISYLRFAACLMPVALVGLGLTYLVVCLVYRKRLAVVPRSQGNAAPEWHGLETMPQHVRAQGGKILVQNGGFLPQHGEVVPQQGAEPALDDGLQTIPHQWREEGLPRSKAHSRLQIKAIVVTLGAVALFFTGLPLELVALGAAAIMLLDRIKPEKVYRQVDWSLLLMFTGLFIVVHAFQVHVVASWGIEGWAWLLDRPTVSLSLVSAALSNLVSNVPAVLLLEPVAQAVPPAARETAWLALAMSSTFAGNLTVLGSVANLIVVESARREGVTITFWEYCKVGIPLTALTLALGIAWLRFVHY